MIETRRTGPAEFIENLDTVLQLYTAAMRPPPDQLSGRLAIMRNHASYPGFSCIFALDPEGVAPRVAGFAYGFHGTPGQWWHDVVRRSLQDRAGPRVAEDWFGDALELAEIHVHPDYQSKGIGRRMIHEICAGRKERTAVLSTHDEPTAARHLYGSVGFLDLMTGFVFPGGYENYAIAGARLPLSV